MQIELQMTKTEHFESQTIPFGTLRFNVKPTFITGYFLMYALI